MRAIEEVSRKTVLLVRARIAQHTGLQACDSVEQGERRNLAAGKDEVAEAQLEVDVTVDETLVDTFVAGAEKHGASGECADRFLSQRLAGRREVDQGRGRRFVAIRPNGGERAFERLDEQHHAGAAAVGPVVDARVRRVAEIAQLPEADVDLPRLEGAPRHAVDEMRLEELGEKGDDVESHRRAFRTCQ